MSERTDRSEPPIEMRFIDLFMIYIAALIFITMMLGMAVYGESPPPRITTEALPVAVLGQSYNLKLAKVGGTAPLNWRIIEGELPPGLELKQDAIEGTAQQTGVAQFSIELRDADSRSTVARFDLDVQDIRPQARRLEKRIWIDGSSIVLPDGQSGQFFSTNLQASGGMPPYHWILLEGMLPPGLSLDAAGNLAGVPVTKPPSTLSAIFTSSVNREVELRKRGTSSFIVAVIDQAGNQFNKQVQVYIKPEPLPLLGRLLLNDFDDNSHWAIRALRVVFQVITIIAAIIFGLIAIIIIFLLLIIAITPAWLICFGYRQQSVKEYRGAFRFLRGRSTSDPYRIIGFPLAAYAITLSRVIDQLLEAIAEVRRIMADRREGKRLKAERLRAEKIELGRPATNETESLVPARPRPSSESIFRLLKELISAILGILFFWVKKPPPDSGSPPARNTQAESGPPEKIGLPPLPELGRAAPSAPSEPKQLTREEEVYLDILRKGAKVKHGGAYMAIAFLQATGLVETFDRIFHPIEKIGNGLIHTSLDKFFQELLNLSGQSNSFSKLDKRLDVVLGRKAPEQKRFLRKSRKSQQENPMQIELVLPTKHEDGKEAGVRLRKAMRNSAQQAQDWLSSILSEDMRNTKGPKMLRRALRREAHIQLKDDVLHVRIKPFLYRSEQKFLESLCEVLNNRGAHTLGRFKFSIKFTA